MSGDPSVVIPREGTIGIWWIEAKDAAKHSILNQTDPTATIMWPKIVAQLKNPSIGIKTETSL